MIGIAAKSEKEGLSGKLLAWVRNFLVGRKQKVVLNSHVSNWSSVSSGVKILKAIRTVDNFYRLQQDINVLFAWSKKWQLKFNISKCNWLHLGKPHGFGEYEIDGTAITSCDVVRDLGIMIVKVS